MRWAVLLVAFVLAVPAIALAPVGGDDVPVEESFETTTLAESRLSALAVAPRALRRTREARTVTPRDDVRVVAVTDAAALTIAPATEPALLNVQLVNLDDLPLLELGPSALERTCAELGLGNAEAIHLPPLDARGRLASLRVESWSPPDRRGERMLEATVDLDVPDDRPSGAHCGRRRTYVIDYDIEVAQSPSFAVTDPVLAEAVDGLRVAASWERRGRRDGLAVHAQWVDADLLSFATDRFYWPVTVASPHETLDGTTAWLTADATTIELASGRRLILSVGDPTVAFASRRRRSAPSHASIEIRRPQDTCPLSASLDLVLDPPAAPLADDPWADASPGWAFLTDGVRVRAIAACNDADAFDVLVDVWDGSRTAFSWHERPDRQPSARLVEAPAARTLLRFRVPPGTSATRDVVLDVGRGPETWTVAVQR